MNFEYFTARRMSRSSDGRIDMMMRIAAAAVATGMAVMIITLSVIEGFSTEINAKLTGLSGHVRVIDVHSPNAAEPHPFRRSDTLERLAGGLDGFVSLAPFAVRGGIVRSTDAVEGIMLKGYAEGGDSFYAESLVEGSMPRIDDSVRHKDILLSRTVADRLGMGVGDKIEMLFVDGERPPRRDRFKISGIYASGMDETDNVSALTDIRNVQRLIDGDERTISGYEIRIDAIGQADEFAAELNEEILYRGDASTDSLAAESIGELYPEIFDWMKTHDVNAAVVIVLMLAVALFNMASALLILVLERTRTIGVLKALGTDDASLRKIFLWRASFIALRGLFWGDVIGVGLCLLQKFTGAVRLDAEGYVLSVMPIDINWMSVAALNAGTIIVIVVGLLIPARIVAGIRPDEAVRYE
ncbi:MAG: ABC transporter permease [Alistipes sp.]|nr:ABC transporter permease [Alistipes sp.]